MLVCASTSKCHLQHVIHHMHANFVSCTCCLTKLLNFSCLIQTMLASSCQIFNQSLAHYCKIACNNLLCSHFSGKLLTIAFCHHMCCSSLFLIASLVVTVFLHVLTIECRHKSEKTKKLSACNWCEEAWLHFLSLNIQFLVIDAFARSLWLFTDRNNVRRN